jgi:hypothetical protein
MINVNWKTNNFINLSFWFNDVKESSYLKGQSHEKVYEMTWDGSFGLT